MRFLLTLKRLILKQKSQKTVKFLGKVFLNIEKGTKKCPFLNALLSFYTVLSIVIQSSELISSYCCVLVFFSCFVLQN